MAHPREEEGKKHRDDLPSKRPEPGKMSPDREGESKLPLYWKNVKAETTML